MYFILSDCKSNEGFMNYEQKRNYFRCKYSNNPYSNKCIKFFNEIEHIKNYIINNPIGYVYKKKLKRPISAWYNPDLRKYHYYVIDYKNNYQINNDIIIHTIDNNGKQLYDNDIIQVPSKGKMKLKLYNDNVLYHSNIFNYKYYNNSTWNIVGYITSNKNNIYKLYEKEYPRGNYRYRIELYSGLFLNIINPSTNKTWRTNDQIRFRNKLYEGDKVKVDTFNNKLFTVYRYKYDDIY